MLIFNSFLELFLAIHNVDIHKGAAGFKSVHEVLMKIDGKLPDNFAQELLDLLYALEGDHHFWVLPMLSYLLTEKDLDEFALMAIEKPKWQTYYMSKSLIKIKRCHAFSTVIEKESFLHTLHKIFPKFNKETKEWECQTSDELIDYPPQHDRIRKDEKQEYL